MSDRTEKANLIEKTYINLIDCHEEIKFSDLTYFEQDRAEKLIKFCRRILEDLMEDERFINLK